MPWPDCLTNESRCSEMLCRAGEESCRLAVTCSTAELSRANGGLAVSSCRGPHPLNSRIAVPSCWARDLRGTGKEERAEGAVSLLGPRFWCRSFRPSMRSWPARTRRHSLTRKAREGSRVRSLLFPRRVQHECPCPLYNRMVRQP